MELCSMWVRNMIPEIPGFYKYYVYVNTYITNVV